MKQVTVIPFDSSNFYILENDVVVYVSIQERKGFPTHPKGIYSVGDTNKYGYSWVSATEYLNNFNHSSVRGVLHDLYKDQYPEYFI
jgi:hypothetical protein